MKAGDSSSSSALVASSSGNSFHPIAFVFVAFIGGGGGGGFFELSEKWMTAKEVKATEQQSYSRATRGEEGWASQRQRPNRKRQEF